MLGIEHLRFQGGHLFKGGWLIKSISMVFYCAYTIYQYSNHSSMKEIYQV